MAISRPRSSAALGLRDSKAPQARRDGTAPQALRDEPVEDWSYLDQEVLQTTRGAQVCMTCRFFGHHAGGGCIPLLTCRWHQGLISHGDHLVSCCPQWQQRLPPGRPPQARGWRR